MRIVLSAVLVAAAAAVTAFATARWALFDRADASALAVAGAASWCLVVAAFLVLRKTGRRTAAIVVMAGSVAMGAAGLAAHPNLSTDSARYAWDGIVQDSGTSPYAYPPAAQALDPLRPAWLFPAPVHAAGETQCPGQRIQTTHETPGGQVLCTALNRATVPTIYPPVAQAFFAAVRAVVPADAEYWPMQVFGLLLSLSVTVLLLRALKRLDLHPAWAAVWGWSPFVTAEAVNNSHIDVLGALLMLAATLVIATGPRSARLGRAALGGALIGLAAAVKFVPAVAAPPLLRRSPAAAVTVAATALGVFAASYVPYIFWTGSRVLGYLPGYLSEEGYDSGSRFALISLVVHGPAATVVAGLLILLTAAGCWWYASPEQPWHAQTVLAGAVLLIVSPAYAWYALTLVPLVALSRRWEWLAVPVALEVRTLYPHLAVTRTALAAAVVIVVAVSVARAAQSRHHWPSAPRPVPLSQNPLNTEETLS